MSTVVWTDRLTAGALPFLWKTARTEGPVRLRYNATTRTGRWGLRFLETFPRVLAEHRHVPYTGHGEHVDGADSEAFLMQDQRNWFVEELARRGGAAWGTLPNFSPNLRREKIEGNLKMVAGTAAYELLELSAFARYWEKKEGASAPRFWVLTRNAFLAVDFPPGWAGNDVRFSAPWSWVHSWWIQWALVLFQFFRDAWRRPRRRPGGPARVGSTLHFQGVDQNVGLSDVHWFWGAGLPPDRVVLCFDRPERPATRAEVREVERHGFQVAILKKKAAGDFSERLWRPAPGFGVCVGRLFRRVRLLLWARARGRLARWTACRIVQNLYRSDELSDFLLDFNIRAFFHYQDTDMDFVTWACETAGAARIGDQWSNHHWPSAGHIRLHHAYFAWGSRYADILRRVGSRVDHLLLSGCVLLGVPRSDATAPDPKSLRARVEKSTVNRVMVFFDTSLPCEGFYRFLLERVLGDDRWGLLLKSKRPANPPWVCDYAPDVAELFARAVRTGRVHLMDWRISPIAAAAAADIAVGIDINTATVVAALAGFRAVHMDYVRLHVGGLAEWAEWRPAGPDRLAFEDPEALWKTLNRFFDEPGYGLDLGLAEPALLARVDPFRDGRASLRIGQYVAWFLEAVDRGETRESSLREASRRYEAAGGAGRAAEDPARARAVGEAR